MAGIKRRLGSTLGPAGYNATGTAEDQQTIADYITKRVGANPVSEAVDISTAGNIAYRQSNTRVAIDSVTTEAINDRAPMIIENIMGPTVDGLVADSIASDDTVANAAASAVDAEPRIHDLRNRTDQLQPGDQAQYRVVDQTGRVGLSVNSDGDVGVGETVYRDSDTPLRVIDKHGAVALEVDAQGRTYIYDPGNETGGDISQLHVFVAVGQSNMSGRGQPPEAAIDFRIKQYGANRRVIETAPATLDMVDGVVSGTSPATFFAHHYLASQPSHVGVLLIPAARGGTAFRGTPEQPTDSWTWIKGAAINPEHDLYERSIQHTQEAIAAAQHEGYQVVLKGVLWSQGGGNAGMSTEAYGRYQDALANDYRHDLEVSTLPFLVGQQSLESLSESPTRGTVDAAHQETPERLPYTGFARATWGGHNPGDTVHFSTFGNQFFGATFYDAYIQALGNTHN